MLALVAIAAGCTPQRAKRGPRPAAVDRSQVVICTCDPPPQLRADYFDHIEGWKAAPSDGVSLALASDSGRTGGAMRMDVDFHGGGGYAVAHRDLVFDLPDNYEISFWIRGTVPPNNLEFKLIDPTGDNVWWMNRRDFVYPAAWTRVVIRKRQISFAWGPLGGGDLKHVGAMEFAVTAGSGGRGSVWIDDLEVRPLPLLSPITAAPALAASSAAPDRAVAAAMDSSESTEWHSTADGTQTLTVDFSATRELGGLTVDWDSADYARDFRVLTSPDGVRWDTAYTASGSGAGRSYAYMPETEARFVRLEMTRSSRGRGYGIREIAVKPLAWSASRNDFFAAIARDAPRGAYPRYLLGEQSYWTITGVDGDSAEALVSEDGMVETRKAGFSLEPFLFADGRLLTWADARESQSLERGYLPIPTVRRESGNLALSVTAFAAGPVGAAQLWARYRVENHGPRAASPTLFVALRPFQVNPSSQFLNNTGGVATVDDLRWNGMMVTADDGLVVPLTPGATFGATTFAGGSIVDALRRGAVPPYSSVHDDFGAASGALAYPLTIAPGARRDVWVLADMGTSATQAPPVATTAAEAVRIGGESLASVARQWETALNRVEIHLPASGRKVENTLRSTLAYILINRDGPAIQPGSRSYERSWIRDGSLTSAALLRLGHADAVRRFAEWYAPFQYPSGKVPCCVDRRGADPVPENDSHGELIYLVAEYARHTGDTTFLREMWPHVRAAAAYLDSLRHLRMTAEYRTPEKRAFYGLLPESISHEGYSAHPEHSYWDDFFALRGLKDAAWIAAELREPDAARYAATRDDFQRDLLASLNAAMAMHHIDFLPGSVELGDFDATSTTVGVAPAEAELPHPALEQTFERYWSEFEARRDGRRVWDAYTPYELRTVGTMLRLGRKDRALAALDWLLTGQRPPEWNAWAEVVWHDPRKAAFVGDLPHTWVGSDFIRSVLDFFAYEREADGALVVGAGIPAAWVTEAPGVSVRGLSTHYGPLTFTMRATGDAVRVRFAPGLRPPPGGIVLRSPLDRPIRAATVDGRTVAPSADGRELRLPSEPRLVVLRY